MTAPVLCLVPGCLRPGMIERRGGRVCIEHIAVTVLSEREARDYVRRLVPHGTAFRDRIIDDAARLLRGISTRPDGYRAGYVRTQALAVLRGTGA